MQVRGISLERELLPAMKSDKLLDTSNYPSSHTLYSCDFKARLGCVKDEAAGEVWREWILLRPKCYSMQNRKQQDHKRAKGIQRCVVSTEMTHDDYVATLEGRLEDYRSVRGFRSKLHLLTTVQQRKRALSLWEDKRAWLSDNNSVAYGHFLLPTAPPFKRICLDTHVHTHTNTPT